MTDREPIEQRNLDIYGYDEIPWSRPREQFGTDSRRSHWLSTVRPDGRPHATAVRALWVDGRFYFTNGPRTRKSRNLAENRSCVLSVSLDDIDLVVEGTATRVTDDATLHRIAERYAAQGWPARVSDGALTADTALRAPASRRGTSTRSRRLPRSESRPPNRTARRAGDSRAEPSRRGGPFARVVRWEPTQCLPIPPAGTCLSSTTAILAQ